VQHRLGLSLGAVRKELRPWIAKPPTPVPSFTPLPKTEKDRLKVEAEYARMQDSVPSHPYLEQQRACPLRSCSLIGLPAAFGSMREANAVFPHFDGDGLSGYELKNVSFTGFASGGTKGLWLSRELKNDNQIIFSRIRNRCSFACGFVAE
jgi:hypothetical protein